MCVSDLLLLGRVTIEEARSLLRWIECEEGFGKMGVCGLSMGMTLSHLWLTSIIMTKDESREHYHSRI